MSEDQAEGFYKYQENWTEGFRSKVDVEFIVEGEAMPAHSMFFYHSEVLEGCFSDTRNDGILRIEACFAGMKRSDMDNFLCQIYPCRYPIESVATKDLVELIEIGIKLDCLCVIGSVVYILENSNVLQKDLESRGIDAIYAWFPILDKLGSLKINHMVLKFVAVFVSGSYTKTDKSWQSLLDTIPASCMKDFVLFLIQKERSARRY